MISLNRKETKAFQNKVTQMTGYKKCVTYVLMKEQEKCYITANSRKPLKNMTPSETNETKSRLADEQTSEAEDQPDIYCF